MVVHVLPQRDKVLPMGMEEMAALAGRVDRLRIGVLSIVWGLCIITRSADKQSPKLSP
jgi:hypothetical protein